jgi:hypothetical protein
MSFEVNAQNPNLSITDVKHQLLSTKTIGARQAHYFAFFITFSNTGDVETDNITVYFNDPELNARLEIGSFTLTPNQNITLVYDEWPTTLLGETTINITYSPTEQGVEHTSYNTGTKAYTFTIGALPDNNQTPGFEIIIFLLSLITFILVLEKRKMY